MWANQTQKISKFDSWYIGKWFITYEIFRFVVQMICWQSNKRDESKKDIWIISSWDQILNMKVIDRFVVPTYEHSKDTLLRYGEVVFCDDLKLKSYEENF